MKLYHFRRASDLESIAENTPRAGDADHVAGARGGVADDNRNHVSDHRRHRTFSTSGLLRGEVEQITQHGWLLDTKRTHCLAVRIRSKIEGLPPRIKKSKPKNPKLSVDAAERRQGRLGDTALDIVHSETATWTPPSTAEQTGEPEGAGMSKLRSVFEDIESVLTHDIRTGKIVYSPARLQTECVSYRGLQGGMPAWISMRDGVVFHNGLDAPGNTPGLVL